MSNRFRACKRLHAQRKCCTKIHYETRQEANQELLRYLDRILFSSMTVYKCNLHGVFHLGHDRYMDNQMIVERDYLLYEQLELGGE